MGSRSSKPIVRPYDINNRITAQERTGIQTEFAFLAGSNDLRNGRIPKDVFVEKSLRNRLPMISKPALDRFFDVLTYRGKDRMDYEEFLHAKYLLDHVPAEPQSGESDLYDLQLRIRDERLLLIFNLLDMDLNDLISRKDLKKILPFVMQNVTIQEYDQTELEPGAQFYDAISDFIMKQFDRSNTQELCWRDFRTLARHDITVADLLKAISPTPPEYPTLAYARKLADGINKNKTGLNRGDSETIESASGVGHLPKPPKKRPSQLHKAIPVAEDSDTAPEQNTGLRKVDSTSAAMVEPVASESSLLPQHSQKQNSVGSVSISTPL